MKKIIGITLIQLIILSLTVSCADFLDKEPDSMLTLEMVFTNKKKTNEWLARVYANVQDALWTDLQYAGVLSDEFQPSFELVQFGDWSHLLGAQQGSWDATTNMHNYWGEFYKAIRSGYIFLDNVQPLPDQGLSEKDVETMRHEVRYLICYYYIYMLQIYGPTPLVTSQFSSQASVEELMLPRTPLDELVDWLETELLYLADFFPEKLKNETQEFGRPTKGACLALRARMWTWVASPLFNGNSYLAQTKNPDGTSIFPASYDAAKWQKAVTANKAVIDLAEKGIYSLYREYNENGTIDPFLSCQNLFLTSGDQNKEIIWARTDANRIEMERHFNPRSNGAYGSLSLTQNLVDEFRMKDGKEISDPSSGYAEDGFTSENLLYPNTGWNYSDHNRTTGLLLPKGSFNMWANREPRFYTTIRFHLAYTIGLQGPAEYAYGQKDGRPSHDTPVCGYLGRKGLDPTAQPISGFWGTYHPAMIFRLAEFYLNYAEALTETNPSDPDILKYLNLIRERGGLSPLPASLSGNKEELRKQIRKEYRIEFAMEGKHRYDYIRRWKLAVDLFKSPIYGLNEYGYDTNPIGDPESFYTRKPIMNRIFDEKMYLWPIRQSFIDRNTNLIQNQGW